MVIEDLFSNLYRADLWTGSLLKLLVQSVHTLKLKLSRNGSDSFKDSAAAKSYELHTHAQKASVVVFMNGNSGC